jgi:hypothetical protein
MIRMTDLTQEEKSGLESLLRKLQLLPPKSCQIVLHCAQGTLQTIEYASLKLK